MTAEHWLLIVNLEIINLNKNTQTTATTAITSNILQPNSSRQHTHQTKTGWTNLPCYCCLRSVYENAEGKCTGILQAVYVLHCSVGRMRCWQVSCNNLIVQLFVSSLACYFCAFNRNVSTFSWLLSYLCRSKCKQATALCPIYLCNPNFNLLHT